MTMNQRLLRPVMRQQTSPPSASGCTDPQALNYDPSATQDDGSCCYPRESGWNECNATYYIGGLPTTLDGNGTGYYGTSYYIGGQQTTLDQNGDGEWNGLYYEYGLPFTGFAQQGGGFSFYYENGTTFTGCRNGVSYWHGDTYPDTYMYTGPDQCGTGYWIEGVQTTLDGSGTGDWNGLYYEGGVPFTGEWNGLYYFEGVPLTGTRTDNGYPYFYYENGLVFSGCTANGVSYIQGETPDAVGHTGADPCGGGYWIGGVQTTLDQNGDGTWNGGTYIGGVLQ